MIVKLPLPPICDTFKLSFFDAKGIYWTREVGSHTLSKAQGEPRLKGWPGPISFTPRRAWISSSCLQPAGGAHQRIRMAQNC
jgi:hypothetical protein